jgi:hypothetical protein
MQLRLLLLNQTGVKPVFNIEAAQKASFVHLGKILSALTA